MSEEHRLVPKPLLLRSEKRPLIYFVTSSLDKLIQARLLFSKVGLELQAFQDAPEYREDYSQSKLKLLEVGVREVARSLGTSTLFFLEDTSVRIEALSTEDRDEPGLEIKDWFSPQAMTELAQRVYRHGLDAHATVRSDVALHVPGLERPVFFSGETSGTIAGSAPSFEQDPRYPWLRPDTFNGWLIPEGSDRRLGEMEFEASLAYDFRAKAFRSLLDRLEEYTAALNLPHQGYALRTRPSTGQPQLPLSSPPALLVIGHTCAGKTTFGERSASRGLHHIEASHVMRTISLPEQVPPDLTAFNRASLLMLQRGFDIVGRQIADIYARELRDSFVITGFRTLQELAFLTELIPWSRIVLIESSEAARYERYLRRERPDDALTLERFRTRDAEHEFFGLLGVAEQIADVRVRNEGSLDEYWFQVDGVIAGRNVSRLRGVMPPLSEDAIRKSQLFRVLAAVGATHRRLTPLEVEEATAKLGTVKRSSVRKVAGDVPALIQRHGDESASQLQLSDAGRAYLQLIRRRLG